MYKKPGIDFRYPRSSGGRFFANRIHEGLSGLRKEYFHISPAAIFNFATLNPAFLIQSGGFTHQTEPNILYWDNVGSAALELSSTIVGAQPNSSLTLDTHKVADFDGTNDIMDTGGVVIPTTIISLSNYTCLMVINPDAATGVGTTTPHTNDIVIGEANGYWGISLLNAGVGQYNIVPWHLDVADFKRVTSAAKVTGSARYVELVYNGATDIMSLRVDADVAVTTSGVGDISNVLGQLILGKNDQPGSIFYNGKIAWCFIKPSVMSAADLTLARNGIKTIYPSLTT